MCIYILFKVLSLNFICAILDQERDETTHDETKEEEEQEETSAVQEEEADCKNMASIIC